MEPQFFVYILYSKSKDRYYIGQTNNLDNRINRHNRAEVRSTKHGNPWIIVYHESFQSRAEAMQRERYLKSLKSRTAIENLISALD